MPRMVHVPPQELRAVLAVYQGMRRTRILVLRTAIRCQPAVVMTLLTLTGCCARRPVDSGPATAAHADLPPVPLAEPKGFPDVSRDVLRSVLARTAGDPPLAPVAEPQVGGRAAATAWQG